LNFRKPMKSMFSRGKIFRDESTRSLRKAHEINVFVKTKLVNLFLLVYGNVSELRKSVSESIGK
jgi:hypothetical protein